MPAVDTPSVVPPNVEDVFQGYSFVAPSVLFAENNVISEDLFRPNPDKKPSTSNLVGCKLKVTFVFMILSKSEDHCAERFFFQNSIRLASNESKQDARNGQKNNE